MAKEDKIKVLERVFLNACRDRDQNPDTTKFPFTRAELNRGGMQRNIENKPDILYDFRHNRTPMPALILNTVPPGYDISILNDEKTRDPFFQYHRRFRIDIDITNPPKTIHCNEPWQPLSESQSLKLIEKYDILEQFFRGDYREIHRHAEHIKCGQWGEIDGVFHAIRNHDNQPVVICANAKTDKERPSGLFAFHNTEIISRRKFPGLPIVHIFVHACVSNYRIDLYHVVLNHNNLTCSSTRGYSYRFCYYPA